jgi:hypothetical protein
MSKSKADFSGNSYALRWAASWATLATGFGLHKSVCILAISDSVAVALRIYQVLYIHGAKVFSSRFSVNGPRKK